MAMHPDSWRVSTSKALCFAEEEGGLWCNYEDQEQTSVVYDSWDDEVDSLRLSGATNWGDVHSYDAPADFCRHDGTGDQSHYGIECWVPCVEGEHCESAHVQMTVMVEGWSSNFFLISPATGDFAELDRNTMQTVSTGNVCSDWG